MRLVDLYKRGLGGVSCATRHIDALYELMAEALPHEVISHKELPTMADHIAYVMSRPYAVWYVIEQGDEILGYVYLSRQNEIGVRLFRKHQGRGVGSWAVTVLMNTHGKQRYLANIAPGNKASARMFQRLGFTHIQNTFALE